MALGPNILPSPTGARPIWLGKKVTGGKPRVGYCASTYGGTLEGAPPSLGLITTVPLLRKG